MLCVCSYCSESFNYLLLKVETFLILIFCYHNNNLGVINNTFYRLTKICTQSVHINPVTIVPNTPNKRPAFLNARGIARIPEPSDPFSKCKTDPSVLRIKHKHLIIFTHL